ncbi:MAG: bifunctional riboflavin kinase/FAD synthetase [Verrucomicrobiae bacterium]|nr:bifunctional riboflavin kinase/FAD synthetase [Verrucomicrobiae bacterium]
MEVIREMSGLGRWPGPLSLAIGVFDGVHVGHQAVIEVAGKDAEISGGSAVVVTFEPHPVEVLAPGKAPRLLTNSTHKLRILEERLGIRHALLIPFDRDFASFSGEDFVLKLLAGAEGAGIRKICVGRDWRFGRERSGDIELLLEMGRAHGFSVDGLDTVSKDGVRVSSTRVREAIQMGDFSLAANLLGRPYSVLGEVVKGRQLGRTLGFPTANLSVRREQLPPAGVYAVRAAGKGESWNGVANLGYRPTVEGGTGELRLEVHLFGLAEEIYGKDIEVEFVEKIREEEEFGGVEELKRRIADDVSEAKRVLEERWNPGVQGWKKLQH